MDKFDKLIRDSIVIKTLKPLIMEKLIPVMYVAIPIIMIALLFIVGLIIRFTKNMHTKTLFFAADETDKLGKKGLTRLYFSILGMTKRYEGKIMQDILNSEGGTPPDISEAIENAEKVFIYVDPDSLTFSDIQQFVNCIGLGIEHYDKYQNTDFVIVTTLRNRNRPEITRLRDKIKASIELQSRYRKPVMPVNFA